MTAQASVENEAQTNHAQKHDAQRRETKKKDEPCVIRGALIINADDWGRDATTTDRIGECFEAGAISSASAMVFMEDSERAAEKARERKFDCGLHLNFTTPFSSGNCPARLDERQRKITRYLRGSRMAQIFYHPGLAQAFDYVVKAQLDEYRRIYCGGPERIDGHHHMHLSANVIFGELIPAGTMVRRNFSFTAGEKSWANRIYRRFLDDRLASRHRLTDYFFSLPPLDAHRLKRIFSLAQDFVVEVESHPVNADEYSFLMAGEFRRLAGGMQVAPRYGAAG